MARTSSTFAVTTSAQKVIDFTDGRGKAWVYNPIGNPECATGGAGITTATGIPLLAGQEREFEGDSSDDDVYIVGASACTVRREIS